MKNRIRYAYVLTLVIAEAVRLYAAPIVLMELGTPAPPATIGGYLMVPVAVVPVAEGSEVTSAGVAPATVAFDYALTHRMVGSQWLTWSHGFTGSVYSFDQVLNGDSLTLTLPVGTRAFQFYVEPEFFGLQDVRIEAVSGGLLQSLGTFSIEGLAGAAGFGVYAPLGEPGLSTITITGETTFPGFAIGELALGTETGGEPGVPDEGLTLAWLGSAIVALLVARRRLLR